LKALEVSEELQQPTEVLVDIIDGIAERYRSGSKRSMIESFLLAKKLQDVTRQTLEEYASLMQQKMNALGLPITVRVVRIMTRQSIGIREI